ncbi:MAG: S16 family serine protease [Candidatus Micrarchaeia archaeon]
MRHSSTVLLLFLLFSCVPAAALSEMRVPAVGSSREGIMTLISVEAQPGSGKIGVEISPLVSVETQESIRAAVEAAALTAGKNLSLFDLRFSISADASSVDGPSGGAAMALLAYAELSGKKLRSDVTASGTIDSDGTMGRVGGVREKLEAAAADGIALFLLARGQSASDDFDYVEYGGVLSNGSMQVIEVSSLKEAAEYAFTPTGSRISGVPGKALLDLNVSKIVPSESELLLRELAEKEIAETRSAIALLDLENLTAWLGGKEAAQAVIRSLNRSVGNAQTLFENGYYYSAANNAFLARVSIQAIRLANASDDEFAGELDALRARMDSIAFPALTPENLEWVAAAQLRYYWAAWKLEGVANSFYEEEAPVSLLAKDLATASVWLSASEKMAASALKSRGGAKYDEFNARNYASRLLDDAENAVKQANASDDAEIAWHLEAARLEFSDAAYVASSFDSSFVLAYCKALVEGKGKSAKRLRALLENESALPGFAGSGWAEAYFAHSLYNAEEANRTGDSSNLLNALKLLELARAWKENSEKLAIELVSPSTPPKRSETVSTPSPSPSQSNASRQIVVATAGLQPPEKPGVFVLFIVVAIVAGVAIVFAVFFARLAAYKKASTQAPPTSPEQMIEKLDLAVAEGRLSERLYEKLVARYEKKAREGVAAKPRKETRRKKARI